MANDGMYAELPQATWRDLVRSKDVTLRGTRDQPGRGPLVLPNPSQVWVRNDVGAALNLGDVVEISSAATDENQPFEDWFVAVVPNAKRPFGFAVDIVPKDEFGQLQMAGCCLARVNVQSTNDRWAYVIAGQRVLIGDPFWGDVRLMVPPTTTGIQRLWVNIEKSPQIWYGRSDEDIAPLTAKTVSIHEGVPPTELDTGLDIPACTNRTSATIPANAPVSVGRIHRQKYVVPWTCEIQS